MAKTKKKSIEENSFPSSGPWLLPALAKSRLRFVALLKWKITQIQSLPKKYCQSKKRLKPKKMLEKFSVEGNSFPGLRARAPLGFGGKPQICCSPSRCRTHFSQYCHSGGSLGNKSSMSVETQKKAKQLQHEPGWWEKGFDTTGKCRPVSTALFPTGDCPFTYFAFGANRGRSCANTHGNTSRVQLTQIPNAQS